MALPPAARISEPQRMSMPTSEESAEVAPPPAIAQKPSATASKLTTAPMNAGVAISAPGTQSQTAVFATYTAPASLDARVAKAVSMLQAPPATWVSDPHVIMALTYSDAFIGAPGHVAGSRLDSEAKKGYPDKVTIRAVVDAMGEKRPDYRVRFFTAMDKLLAAHQLADATIKPLDHFDPGDPRQPNHPDAIDLFVTREADPANPVRSMRPGVVISAEQGWSKDTPAATSSALGGNVVTIYDSKRRETYRYAHLSVVNVRPGEVVPAGTAIALVGSTGEGASQHGHGKHLHFEIRTFPLGMSSQATSVLDKELRVRIANASANPIE